MLGVRPSPLITLSGLVQRDNLQKLYMTYAAAATSLLSREGPGDAYCVSIVAKAWTCVSAPVFCVQSVQAMLRPAVKNCSHLCWEQSLT